MNTTHTVRRTSVGLGLAAVLVGGGITATAAPASDAPALGFSMADTNQASYWEAYLEDRGYTDVTCTKEEFTPDAESYTLTATPPEGTEFVLLVLKASSTNAPDVDDENDLVWNPVQGQTYTHTTGKDLSHVILCSGVAPEETSSTTTDTSTTTTDTSTTTTDTSTTTTDTSTTTTDTSTTTTDTDTSTTTSTTTSATTTGGTAPTGPIVETDGVTATDDNTWALLGGLSVMLAGAGLAASGLRRRADES